MNNFENQANQVDDQSPTNIFSFIVHIWNEEATAKKRQAVWRGSITSIPDGKRHYFISIEEIPAIIAAQLKTAR